MTKTRKTDATDATPARPETLSRRWAYGCVLYGPTPAPLPRVADAPVVKTRKPRVCGCGCGRTK
jgi:hypothetical protein